MALGTAPASSSSSSSSSSSIPPRAISSSSSSSATSSVAVAISTTDSKAETLALEQLSNEHKKVLAEIEEEQNNGRNNKALNQKLAFLEQKISELKQEVNKPKAKQSASTSSSSSSSSSSSIPPRATSSSSSSSATLAAAVAASTRSDKEAKSAADSQSINKDNIPAFYNMLPIENLAFTLKHGILSRKRRDEYDKRGERTTNIANPSVQERRRIKHIPYKNQQGKLRSDVELDLAEWYDEDTINQLLRRHLPETILQIAQTQMEHANLLQDNLQQAIQEVRRTHQPAVIPIHLHGNHWAGLVIKLKPDGHLQVIYNDPKGNKLDSEKLAAEVVGHITAQDKAAEIIDLSLKQQDNDNDCGPFTIDNLVKLATKNTVGQSREAIVNLLQQPADGSARTLREQQHVLLQSVLPTDIRISGIPKKQQGDQKRPNYSMSVPKEKELSLHRFANLYLNPHNAMMAEVTDNRSRQGYGIQHGICVLQISREILHRGDVILTNQNAATAECQFIPADNWTLSPRSAKFLYRPVYRTKEEQETNSTFDRIAALYREKKTEEFNEECKKLGIMFRQAQRFFYNSRIQVKHDEIMKAKTVRQAEALVRSKVKPRFITKILVADEDTQKAVQAIVAASEFKHIPVVIHPTLFQFYSPLEQIDSPLLTAEQKAELTGEDGYGYPSDLSDTDDEEGVSNGEAIADFSSKEQNRSGTSSSTSSSSSSSSSSAAAQAINDSKQGTSLQARGMKRSRSSVNDNVSSTSSLSSSSSGTLESEQEEENEQRRQKKLKTVTPESETVATAASSSTVSAASSSSISSDSSSSFGFFSSSSSVAASATPAVPAGKASSSQRGQDLTLHSDNAAKPKQETVLRR
jgi:hypothetical protein